MASGIDLLRLLEPAVRPDGLQGSRCAPKEPFESRSFESLLEEAQSQAQVQARSAESATNKTKAIDPLGPLARVDGIDNAALLKIIGNDRAGTARLAE